jgi:hypothetical protein
MIDLDYQNAKLHTLPNAPTLRTANWRRAVTAGHMAKEKVRKRMRVGSRKTSACRSGAQHHEYP